MRAIVIHAAHDLRIEERPVEAPGPGRLRLRLATGGVCGSDLHYYNHGGFGAIRLREPMILGHEVSAHVEELGPTVGEAVMAEPLADSLHATRRAGSMSAKRVLVTGCGPIGALAILAARRAGASEIVVTDLSDFTLGLAKKVGADRVINTAKEPEALVSYAVGKGYFDVLYECTGVAAALNVGIAAMRPRGVILQLGLGGDLTLPMMAITAKELDLRGSFRFHPEFAHGVALMQKGLIDTKPLITHTVPLTEAEQAFKMASDRSRAMKAQIAFS